MKAFVRLAALVVGFGNGYILIVGGVPGGVASYQLLDLLKDAGIVAVLGLLAAEIVLRFGREALEGSFRDRYAALVATVCLGGAFYGVTLALGGIVQDASLGTVGLIGFSAVASLWGVLCGGVLGLLEGAVFGLPLAAVLGLFTGDSQRETHLVRPKATSSKTS